jgi:hypothetical protein
MLRKRENTKERMKAEFFRLSLFKDLRSWDKGRRRAGSGETLAVNELLGHNNI